MSVFEQAQHELTAVLHAYSHRCNFIFIISKKKEKPNYSLFQKESAQKLWSIENTYKTTTTHIIELKNYKKTT